MQKENKTSKLSVGYSIFIIQKKFCDHFEHDLIDKGLKGNCPEFWRSGVLVCCKKTGVRKS
jgi:hypothetical protein